MRSLIVMAMFASSLTHGAWNGYTETRDLEISSDGVEILEIDAGAGDLVVSGSSNSSNIIVRATIHVDDSDDDAIKKIEKHLSLNLEKKRSKAMLDAYFDKNFWHSMDSAAVDLHVSIPHGLAIFVDDGSGSMQIMDVQSDVSIDDGSGSIEISGANSVFIDDGSGSVKISEVSGDVEVDDGSGNIEIETVGGTVIIDDGSGSIDVKDVEKDLEIVDDGSGSVRIADVRGSVYRDD